MGIAAYFASLNFASLPRTNARRRRAGHSLGFDGIGRIHYLPAAGRGRSERGRQLCHRRRRDGHARSSPAGPRGRRCSWRCLSGVLAGLCTGLLHTKLGIPAILAGILTQFALYSMNLRIMGMKANQTASLKNYGMFWENGEQGFPRLLALCARRRSPSGFLLSGVLIALFYWYFGTEQGSGAARDRLQPRDEPRAGHQH